jgi:hypothetical protein
MQNFQIKIVNKLRIIIALLMFFTLNLSLSQSINEIKKNDTVYIYFKKSTKNEIKEVYPANKIKMYDNRIDYIFSTDHHNTIFFLYSDYLNSNDYEKGIKTDVKTLKKSFIRRNKHRVIDIDFFLKNGFKETYMNALYGKIVYLIDSSENKSRKIKAKQVTIISNYHEL